MEPEQLALYKLLIGWHSPICNDQIILDYPKGSVAKTMATVVSSVAVSQFATYGKYDVRIYHITSDGDHFITQYRYYTYENDNCAQRPKNDHRGE